MKQDFEAILTEAHDAARDAVSGMVENPNALDCGFAWVTVDGRSPLANYCRRMVKNSENHNAAWSRYGSPGHPGWQFWKPGAAPVQSIGIHEAGAKAFQQVLVKHNINSTFGSRYD